MRATAGRWKVWTILVTVVGYCSAQTLPSRSDAHRKCSEWEERHCIQGLDRFHYCTTITAEEWKIRLFGPHQSRLFCECREGFTIPLRQAYEDKAAPRTECVSCQEEGVVYFGFNLPVGQPSC